MNFKRYLLPALMVILLIFTSANYSYAQDDSEGILPLVLDMYKYEQYLPAIDILEAEQEKLKDVFNYWLYLGLAYQRTNQLEKALSAYEKASKLNEEATNLAIRIKNLKKAISDADKTQIKDFKTDNEKAAWLFELADAQRDNKEKEEKAFRIFIQAVEYNIQYLSNDKGFVRYGVAYYKLKVKEKAECSKLFYAIYKYFEGEIPEAYKLIKEFKNSDEEKSLAILKMENEYFKKLAEASNEMKELEKAEKEYAKQQKEELERARLAALEKESTNTSSNTETSSNKPSRKERSTDIRELEEEINENTFGYRNDKSFLKSYANEVAEIKAAEFMSTGDVKTKKELIWEMGHTGSQSESVMNCIIEGINMQNLDVLANCTQALMRIGSPSADRAVPSLVNLLDSERPGIRLAAIDAIIELKSGTELVVEKLVQKYDAEENEYIQGRYAECVKLLGEPALEAVYRKLNEAPRLERKPIATLINKVTGEKVQDLINR